MPVSKILTRKAEQKRFQGGTVWASKKQETVLTMPQPLQSPFTPATPNPQKPRLEIIATLPQSVGNVTFVQNGRTFFTHHPFYKPDIRVAELMPGGTTRPYPNKEWNTPRPGTDAFFASPLGIRADENGILWVLDMGGPRIQITPKLVGWNTQTNTLEKIIRIPAPAAIEASALNDFVVDTQNNFIYITDEGTMNKANGGKAAIVVVNLETGASRRVLQGDTSTRPENLPTVIEGRVLQVPGPNRRPQIMRVGADGIACDTNFEYLYYGPLTGRTVYRIRTADLRDETLSPAQLSQKVEAYAKKPISGGMSMDSKGNLYFTQVQDKTIGIIPAGKTDYRAYVSHPLLLWPDGISFSPDGFMVVSASQVGWSPATNGGRDLSRKPFHLFRFVPQSPGRRGH